MVQGVWLLTATAMCSSGFELLTIKIQKMTIENTNDKLPTAPAITYSECYRLLFFNQINIKIL